MSDINEAMEEQIRLLSKLPTTEEILEMGKEPTKATRLFRVVLEQISEEVIEIEAEDELSAIELAISGEGDLVDGITFSPTIVHSEELDD